MSKECRPLKTGEADFPTEVELSAFANKFAPVLQTPLVFWLQGDLGAGKTAFTRALIHALGYKSRVKSPTYGLLESYQIGDIHALHLDLYRISDPGELEFLGLEDLMDEHTIVLIEWPDRGQGCLPQADFVFLFSYADQGRKLHWQACSETAVKVIDAFLTT